MSPAGWLSRSICIVPCSSPTKFSTLTPYAMSPTNVDADTNSAAVLDSAEQSCLRETACGVVPASSRHPPDVDRLTDQSLSTAARMALAFGAAAENVSPISAVCPR